MARPKGIIETRPRKQMVGRASTDSYAYVLSDSGCLEATLFLGHSSLCLECPFPECKSKEKDDRLEKLRSER